jgi:hypothetical protein
MNSPAIFDEVPQGDWPVRCRGRGQSPRGVILSSTSRSGARTKDLWRSKAASLRPATAPAFRAARHRARHAATQPIGCSWETTHGGIQPQGCPVETVRGTTRPRGCPTPYPGRRDPALGLPGPVLCAQTTVGALAWERGRAGSRWHKGFVWERLRSFVARAASRRAAQDDTPGGRHRAAASDRPAPDCGPRSARWVRNALHFGPQRARLEAAPRPRASRARMLTPGNGMTRDDRRRATGLCLDSHLP